MADIIKYLPESIINRIAAGEIIERPSSVIKELLENSLDAEAKIIDIFLINSGKTLIKVSDNGKGMSQNDASICFKKYTTSKITNIEDLFKIYTKGFRGEALASISSISQLEIITKNNISEIGLHIFIDGNKINKKIPIQINTGTNILVKNIFFNIPVRRNLLKSNKIELDFIIYELSKLALAHFNVTFRLYNNNNLIFNLKSSSLKERIVSIFSEKINKELIFFLDKENNIKIKGFISKPFYSKKDKSEQFLFINNRFFYDKYLHKNILIFYKDYLKIGHYPSYFIFLYLDPKKFDINIDPTKKIINFYEKSIIYNLINKNIQLILGKYKTSKVNYLKKITSFNSFLYQNKNNYIINNLKNENISIINNRKEIVDKIKVNLFNNKCIQIFNYNKNILLKKQIYKKYIITFFNDKLIIINQNRAHQRILYEKFLIIYKKKIIIRNLIIPITIDISIKECEFLKSLENDFKNIGLIIEFYNNYIIIKSIPYYLNNKNIINFINEVLVNKTLKNEIKNYFNILISCIAKSKAIKSGIKLNNEEINSLINELFLCKNINYSPFNKIIYITLDKNYFLNAFRKK